MVRTVLSHTNCGDINLQYISVSVSSSMGFEEHEISHSSDSEREVEPRSTS